MIERVMRRKEDTTPIKSRIPRQLLGETAGNVEISNFADVGKIAQ